MTRCSIDKCSRDARRGPRLCDHHYRLCSVPGCLRQAQLGGGIHRRCARHLPCPADGCSNYGSYNVEEVKDVNPYCLSHRCCHDFCTRQGVKNVDGELLCEEHGSHELHCMKAGCTVTYAFEVSSDVNPYCPHHRCGSGLCTQEASQEIRGQPFCAEHFASRTCAEPDCIEQRKKNELRLPYCARHLLCGVPNCKESRRPHSRLCEKHKCMRDDCEVPVELVLDFCPEHLCKGFLDRDRKRPCPLPTVPFNNGPKREWSSYCGMHTCQLALRMNIGCSKFNENHAYCSDHRCGAPNCDHPQPIDPADFHSSSVSGFCACHQGLRKEQKEEAKVTSQMNDLKLGPQPNTGYSAFLGRPRHRHNYGAGILPV